MSTKKSWKSYIFQGKEDFCWKKNYRYENPKKCRKTVNSKCAQKGRDSKRVETPSGKV
jgi:hypothetical protein